VGQAEAADLLFGAPDSDVPSAIGYHFIAGGDAGIFWLFQSVLSGASPPSLPAFDVFLPTKTLVGCIGGPLCTTSVLRGDIVTSGTLVSGAQGPELESGIATSVPEPTISLLFVAAFSVLLLLQRRKNQPPRQDRRK
jgi:hypothetical protein